jgi:hypothetical protein
MREAQGYKSKKDKRRKRSRGSEYSELNPPSDYSEDEEFGGGLQARSMKGSYKGPRSVKTDKIPYNKKRTRSRTNVARENLMDAIPKK